MLNLYDQFLRTKFICIIWTFGGVDDHVPGSWGLSLFVLFEPTERNSYNAGGSWGLSLFVLFEQLGDANSDCSSSWGLSLFVLFEQILLIYTLIQVLED